jgi:hypothetical protein
VVRLHVYAWVEEVAGEQLTMGASTATAEAAAIMVCFSSRRFAMSVQHHSLSVLLYVFSSSCPAGFVLTVGPGSGVCVVL